MIMNRMTLLRDIAVFVVTQKIHHFTPGWYHIHVGRHVERPCNHAVGTAVCFCVIQVSTVNLNCPYGSPRTKMACCKCKRKIPPLPSTVLQNLWQYRYAVKCYKFQCLALLFLPTRCLLLLNLVVKIHHQLVMISIAHWGNKLLTLLQQSGWIETYSHHCITGDIPPH